MATNTDTITTKNYVIETDAFGYETDAESLDEAIEEAFAGEIKGITNVESLERIFAKYVTDGGWCFVEENGERVVEIGEC